jgi:hypothetical protein
MKRAISILGGGLLLLGCSRQDTDVGGSPNYNTGMGEQNTVVEASADTNELGNGHRVSQGAALNEAEGSDTNNSAKPQLPPLR